MEKKFVTDVKWRVYLQGYYKLNRHKTCIIPCSVEGRLSCTNEDETADIRYEGRCYMSRKTKKVTWKLEAPLGIQKLIEEYIKDEEVIELFEDEKENYKMYCVQNI